MCDALTRMLEISGVPVGMNAAGDNASHYTTSITKEVMKKVWYFTCLLVTVLSRHYG